jgi:hypothetical protein
MVRGTRLAQEGSNLHALRPLEQAQELPSMGTGPFTRHAIPSLGGDNEARCSRRVRYAVGHDLAARDAEWGHRRG